MSTIDANLETDPSLLTSNPLDVTAEMNKLTKKLITLNPATTNPVIASKFKKIAKPVQITKEESKEAYKHFFLMEKIAPDAFEFIKNNPSDAGYDISAYGEGTVPAWGSVLVETKIKVGIPFGCYGRIASRSGLAVKHNIEVGAGVIDPGYLGEVKVLLRNFSDNPFTFKRGDRIAQFIITLYKTPQVRVVQNVTALSIYSDRGELGFGSSGVDVKKSERL
jgi:dUTP pyrophosphatase